MTLGSISVHFPASVDLLPLSSTESKIFSVWEGLELGFRAAYVTGRWWKVEGGEVGGQVPGAC